MRKPLHEDFPISQRFGENPLLYTRFGLPGHNGVDFACPVNTPVLVCLAGTVTQVSRDDGGYGLHVRVEHEGGRLSLYAHLAHANVTVGQRLLEGEMLGRSGSSGFSTGPHLHFEVRQGGQAIDPLPLLGGLGQILFRARAVGKVVNVRSGPGLQFGIVRRLEAGQEVQVSDLSGSTVWVQVGPGEFCALRYCGMNLLEAVSE